MKKPRKKSAKVVRPVSMAEIDAANRARFEAHPFMRALKGAENSAGSVASGSMTFGLFSMLFVFFLLCAAGCPQ
jgi:hypothetical protein